VLNQTAPAVEENDHRTTTGGIAHTSPTATTPTMDSVWTSSQPALFEEEDLPEEDPPSSSSSTELLFSPVQNLLSVRSKRAVLKLTPQKLKKQPSLLGELVLSRLVVSDMLWLMVRTGESAVLCAPLAYCVHIRRTCMFELCLAELCSTEWCSSVLCPASCSLGVCTRTAYAHVSTPTTPIATFQIQPLRLIV
jgi:hypothetical protein